MQSEIDAKKWMQEKTKDGLESRNSQLKPGHIVANGPKGDSMLRLPSHTHIGIRIRIRIRFQLYTLWYE